MLCDDGVSAGALPAGGICRAVTALLYLFASLDSALAPPLNARLYWRGVTYGRIEGGEGASLNRGRT